MGLQTGSEPDRERPMKDRIDDMLVEVAALIRIIPAGIQAHCSRHHRAYALAAVMLYLNLAILHLTGFDPDVLVGGTYLSLAVCHLAAHLRLPHQ
jgi:hypothetical protein